MNWRSHAIIGAICSAIAVYLLGITNLFEILGFAIFGGLAALAPDLDHDMSKGRKLLDIGFILTSFFVLYWSGCHNKVCIPEISLFVVWLAVLGGYFLLFRLFKPKHRGITHTIVATLVFGVLLYLVLDWRFALVGLIGYLSHLFADKMIKFI
ncbi:MAG: metal-dependent hydrolase [Candidatus Micrarchaeota archaeon]